MAESSEVLAVSLFSELIATEQLARLRFGKLLPKGMELSHFMVLNHLSHSGGERTPAQLASAFHLTRGAMTNTISKLEWAGWVHVRPDWDDARSKLVSISPSGVAARDAAIAAIAPMISDLVEAVGPERAKTTLPILRELRIKLASSE